MFSQEEFARILHKAAELSDRAEPAVRPAGGLRLSEIQAAAAEVGFDPVLVERAARLLPTVSRGSALERGLGGPVRHVVEVHLPGTLDAAGAERLLQAVRVRGCVPGGRDVGHAGPAGMTWHDGGETETLGVTARPVADGTSVVLTHDRQGTLAVLVVGSAILLFLLTLFSMYALHPEAAVLGYGGFGVGLVGLLGALRAVWSASTRRARARLDLVLEAVDEASSAAP